MIAKINDDRALALARDVLDIEANAVRALAEQLDGEFVAAVGLLLNCRGRVVVSGIGKSGHIARKIAATLASTGTPAFFVHPAEASHGDLGMVTKDDVFVAISNSGESEELVAILPLIKRLGAKLIAMTGRPASSLAMLSDVHLNAGVAKEACPLNLAPTASTTAALALGDALANVLASQGYAVHREFYYNDAGVQIGNLAISTQARARGLKPGDAGWPEAAYNGEYIADIARDYLNGETVAASDGEPVTGKRDVEDLEAIRKFAVTYLRREQDMDLKAFGVKFDQYYLESSLYTEGRVEKTVDALIAAGMTYEQEGALWLRTTDEGDDKDRVMRKTDGTYTYFVPDVAYHVTKWERGFTKVINIQGSDHHGTIARVRAGLQGLHIGIPKGYPDYVLHKMVTVMRDGQEVKISKRAGSYVTVRDLIEWSGGATPGSEGSPELLDEATITRGRDAVRFFLISRKADTEFVFDIDLALKQNDENPVYYVQYAHARICSVINEWKSRYGATDALLPGADLSPLDSKQAMALMQKLAEYPDVLAHAAGELAPHAVAFYLRELASEFHSFYNAERVLVDEQAPRTARVALLAATRQVLENGLAMLGVSAPSKM